MIRTFLLLVSILFLLSVNAQQKIFELSVGWWGGASVLNTFTASVPQQFVVVLGKKDSVKVFLLNSSHKIEAQFSLAKNPNEKFSGGFAKQDTIAIYYESHNVIHSWVYHIPTNKIQDYIIEFDPRKEKHLAKVSTGNRYMHIATSKKAPVVITYDFSAQGTFERFEYNLRDIVKDRKISDDAVWNEMTKSSDITREPDLGVVNSFELTAPEAASNASKIYYRSDSLFLVTNKFKEKIKILSFDLNNRKFDYRIMNILPPVQTANPLHTSSVYNSFMHGDRLYYVNASEDGLLLSINNFYTGEEISRFQAGKKDTISFKNTPIIQDGGGTMYSMNAHRELDRTKQLIRKMMGGSAIISVSLNSQLKNEIIIGGVKELSTGGGGGLIGGAVGGVLTSPAVFGATWTKVTRFTTITDPLTDKHVPGDFATDVIEKVEAFKKGIKSDDDSEAIININNTPSFIYYDKETRKLTAVAIRTS